MGAELCGMVSPFQRKGDRVTPSQLQPSEWAPLYDLIKSCGPGAAPGKSVHRRLGSGA